MFLPITKFLQYNLGHESQWNAYNNVIPKGCCILCKQDNSEDIIFKIGDNIHYFQDLPIVLYFKYIYNTYFINNIDLTAMVDIDYILYLDNNLHIKATPFKESDLYDLFTGKGSADLGFNLIEPIINGPDKVGINTLVKYGIDAYSLFKSCNISISETEWTLPDDSIVITSGLDPLSYTTPVDNNLIGNIISISVRVKNELNYWSRSVSKDIELIDTGYIGCIINTDFVE